MFFGDCVVEDKGGIIGVVICFLGFVFVDCLFEFCCYYDNGLLLCWVKMFFEFSDVLV